MKGGSTQTEPIAIPNGWVVRRIKEMASSEINSFTDGDWIESPYIKQDGIRLVQTGNIGDGFFRDQNKKFISESDFHKLRCKEIVAGDVLICRLAEPIGRACILPNLKTKAITSVDVTIFRPNDKIVDPYFIKEAINFLPIRNKIISLSGGSTRQRINRSNLGNVEILLPSLEEQRVISDILSTVDEKIDVIDAQITQTQELKKGLMQQLLTKGIGHTKFKASPLGEIPESWTVKNIEHIATVVRGASPRPKGDPRYYGGNIPRLMGEDVTRDKKYVTPSVDFLTDEGAKLSRFMKAGTLVMVCSGNVGVPSILAVDACVHDGFLAFPEISTECDKEFLYYVFDSLQQKFHSSATHGGIFTNLTTSIIKTFTLALPPFEEQLRIRDILNAVDEKIFILERKKAGFINFKKGLMKQLLTGKLRVNHLIENEVLV